MDKRKAFNFYRSYFEVAQQLPKKHQLAFIQAILNYQFEGIEPTNTKGFELAWISQKHSLDRQLEGYKHGVKGGRPPKGKVNPPLKGNSNQDKGQGQVQYVKEQLEAHTVWREDLLRHHNIELKEYLKHLKDFIATESLDREFDEVQTHWKRWLNKRDLKKKRTPVEHWVKIDANGKPL